MGVFSNFLQVEVQMADHALSAADAIFEANFAVKMGEIIVTGKQSSTSTLKTSLYYMFLYSLAEVERKQNGYHCTRTHAE